MTYDELLRELNHFDVSVLNPEQLKTLKAALQVKTCCVNYYQRVAQHAKYLASNSKKCGD